MFSVLDMHDNGMGVETAATVKLSSILSSLSYALDLTEGTRAATRRAAA